MKLIIDIHEKDYQAIKNGHIPFSVLDVIMNGIPLPKCNECKYYEGVHKVQGHAPCSYHTIGGVMWDWYCSQFEADKGSESE